ncbi:MAG: hypothetical protein IJN42_01840 [Clostridia bacterium]|nr:hypothetical protein [Clostridia bacterium]
MSDRERITEILKAYAKKNNISASSVILEEYAEELLANGVIAPLCKVGGKIFQTDGVRIYESTIGEITFTTHKMICVTENIAFDETAIGKSIFLTKEKAENALKGREKK